MERSLQLELCQLRGRPVLSEVRADFQIGNFLEVRVFGDHGRTGPFRTDGNDDVGNRQDFPAPVERSSQFRRLA